ncbi:hypothetical protein K3495_g13207 [Podosphaera aphanis]|nr:hypothetical protein K3495_g13207 [Podosphaera aphanis]
MPPAKPQKPNAANPLKPLSSRASKQTKTRSVLLPANKDAIVDALALGAPPTILLPYTNSPESDMDIEPVADTNSDIEDEQMADETSVSVATITPTPTASKSPVPPLTRAATSERGLAGSNHAGPSLQTKASIPSISPKRTIPHHNSSSRRVVSHLSPNAINELAATLNAWQNAGARYLQSLPPAIAADLQAITIQSAARVLSGLPVFHDAPNCKNSPTQNTAVKFTQSPPNFQASQRKNSLSADAPLPCTVAPMNANSTSTFSYAKAARLRAPAQAIPAHATVLDIRNPRPSSNSRSCSSNADARVIARLPTSHPLRGEDTLLVRTKLRQLLDRPELIKDMRIVPTGLALVAPSQNLVPDLLLAAEKLQPLLGNVPLERQEKRINFLLGPVPKYGYNAHGAREDLTFDEIRQELADAKVDPKSIFAMSWTHRSRDSPHSDGTLRLVISERATQNLPSNIRLFARSVRLRPADDRPQMQVCSKCHGFHNVNACLHRPRCGLCASDTHTGPCSTPPKCSNCLGPHISSDVNCPARPRRVNGSFARPDGARLQSIRREGHKSWTIRHSPQPSSSVEVQPAGPALPTTPQPCASPIPSSSPAPTLQTGACSSPRNNEDQL